MQKEHTSLKARKARGFKSKGVLLRAFALVCLIFYVACSVACRPFQRKRKKEEEEADDNDDDADEA